MTYSPPIWDTWLAVSPTGRNTCSSLLWVCSSRSVHCSLYGIGANWNVDQASDLPVFQSYCWQKLSMLLHHRADREPRENRYQESCFRVLLQYQIAWHIFWVIRDIHVQKVNCLLRSMIEDLVGFYCSIIQSNFQFISARNYNLTVACIKFLNRNIVNEKFIWCFKILCPFIIEFVVPKLHSSNLINFLIVL